jgi:hypothetical protein
MKAPLGVTVISNAITLIAPNGRILYSDSGSQNWSKKIVWLLQE